jgi:hypothetical protein
MSHVEWIVCERTGRWATALRMALGRSGWPPQSVPRLFEVRQLGELAARLDMRPDSLALVEVQRASFADVLIWLAEAGREHRRARFVALVDRGVWESIGSGLASRRCDRRPVVDALREAGADEVVTSPRQLQGVLALGRRHASLRAVHPNSLSAQMSIAAWAWQSLPWQED